MPQRNSAKKAKIVVKPACVPYLLVHTTGYYVYIILLCSRMVQSTFLIEMLMEIALNFFFPLSLPVLKQSGNLICIYLLPRIMIRTFGTLQARSATGICHPFLQYCLIFFRIIWITRKKISNRHSNMIELSFSWIKETFYLE